MKLTAQIEYAYWALLDLCEHYDPEKTVNLNEISKRNGIPEKYLLQVMLKLKRENMVHSRRGSGGGFQLSRRPEEIELSEMVSILGGAHGEIRSAFDKNDGVRPNPDCAFFDIWRNAREAFIKELSGHTLKSLLAKEKRARKKASP